ncbi:MAG TPA: hypothetical protein O0X42_00750, partial [Methanocorpusculum sp.]|nr:hypothetical protein [Methanocorpusculum sp.]
WTAEDKEAFDAKTQKVAAYLSTIEAGPGVHVNGDLVVTESIADFGGLAAVLEAASQIDDFDYDAFFRNYASAWKIVMSKDKLAEKLVSDEHPPGSVRVNTNVQQYEEFYTAYDVQPGDGMYLAPEDRVAVW